MQIVARLPPRIDGVGDYAQSLAEGMRRRHGIESRFIVCGDPQGQDSGTARCLREQTTAEFLRVIGEESPAALVLHYVGYGYAANGAPGWLVRGLEAWLGTRPNVSVTTVFHELYATSPPWRRAFWYSLRQKAVTRRVLALSSRALCTIARNEAVLRRWRPHTAISRLAIPSGVGEPARFEVPAWEEKEPAMVVFGRPHSRELGYARAEEVARACARLGIERIVDIGGSGRIPARIGGVAIEACGELSASQVSERLSRSRYGYLYYPADYLAKSSIFAAYSAHEMTAIIPAAGVANEDGLAPGIHYSSFERMEGDAASARTIAANAAVWYRGHAIDVHVDWIAAGAYGVCEDLQTGAT